MEPLNLVTEDIPSINYILLPCEVALVDQLTHQSNELVKVISQHMSQVKTNAKIINELIREGMKRRNIRQEKNSNNEKRHKNERDSLLEDPISLYENYIQCSVIGESDKSIDVSYQLVMPEDDELSKEKLNNLENEQLIEELDDEQIKAKFNPRTLSRESLNSSHISDCSLTFYDAEEGSHQVSDKTCDSIDLLKKQNQENHFEKMLGKEIDECTTKMAGSPCASMDISFLKKQKQENFEKYQHTPQFTDRKIASSDMSLLKYQNQENFGKEYKWPTENAESTPKFAGSTCASVDISFLKMQNQEDFHNADNPDGIVSSTNFNKSNLRKSGLNSKQLKCIVGSREDNLTGNGCPNFEVSSFEIERYCTADYLNSVYESHMLELDNSFVGLDEGDGSQEVEGNNLITNGAARAMEELFLIEEEFFLNEERLLGMCSRNLEVNRYEYDSKNMQDNDASAINNGFGDTGIEYNEGRYSNASASEGIDNNVRSGNAEYTSDSYYLMKLEQWIEEAAEKDSGVKQGIRKTVDAYGKLEDKGHKIEFTEQLQNLNIEMDSEMKWSVSYKSHKRDNTRMDHTHYKTTSDKLYPELFQYQDVACRAYSNIFPCLAEFSDGIRNIPANDHMELSGYSKTTDGVGISNITDDRVNYQIPHAMKMSAHDEYSIINDVGNVKPNHHHDSSIIIDEKDESMSYKSDSFYIRILEEWIDTPIQQTADEVIIKNSLNKYTNGESSKYKDGSFDSQTLGSSSCIHKKLIDASLVEKLTLESNELVKKAARCMSEVQLNTEIINGLLKDTDDSFGFRLPGSSACIGDKLKTADASHVENIIRESNELVKEASRFMAAVQQNTKVINILLKMQAMNQTGNNNKEMINTNNYNFSGEITDLRMDVADTDMNISVAESIQLSDHGKHDASSVNTLDENAESIMPKSGKDEKVDIFDCNEDGDAKSIHQSQVRQTINESIDDIYDVLKWIYLQIFEERIDRLTCELDNKVCEIGMTCDDSNGTSCEENVTSTLNANKKKVIKCREDVIVTEHNEYVTVTECKEHVSVIEHQEGVIGTECKGGVTVNEHRVDVTVNEGSEDVTITEHKEDESITKCNDNFTVTEHKEIVTGTEHNQDVTLTPHNEDSVSIALVLNQDITSSEQNEDTSSIKQRGNLPLNDSVDNRSHVYNLDETLNNYKKSSENEDATSMELEKDAISNAEKEGGVYFATVSENGDGYESAIVSFISASKEHTEPSTDININTHHDLDLTHPGLEVKSVSLDMNTSTGEFYTAEFGDAETTGHIVKENSSLSFKDLTDSLTVTTLVQRERITLDLAENSNDGITLTYKKQVSVSTGSKKIYECTEVFFGNSGDIFSTATAVNAQNTQTMKLLENLLTQNDKFINVVFNRKLNTATTNSMVFSNGLSTTGNNKASVTMPCNSVMVNTSSVKVTMQKDTPKVTVTSGILRGIKHDDIQAFKPSADVNLTKLSAGMNVSKPSVNVKVSKPSDNMKVSKPSGIMKVSKPSGDVNVSKPSDNIKVSKPDDDSTVNKPSDYMKASKPSFDVKVPKPSVDLKVSKPIVEVKVPIQSIDMYRHVSKTCVDVKLPKPIVKVEVSKPGSEMKIPNPGVDVKVFKPGNMMVFKLRVDVQVSKPSVDLKVPKPGDDMKVSKPSGDIKVPKPGVPKPGVDLKVSKPNVDVKVSKPSGNMNIPKPCDDVKIFKPSDKPIDNVKVVKPRSAMKISKPSGKMKVSIPSANSKITKPSGHVNVIKPSDKMNVSKPSDNVMGTKPSDKMKVSKPSDNLMGIKPSDKMKVSKPSDNVMGTKPKDKMKIENISKPVGKLKVSRPSGDIEVPKPSADLMVPKASGNIEVAKPSGNTKVSKPSDNVMVTKPGNNMKGYEPCDKAGDKAIDNVKVINSCGDVNCAKLSGKIKISKISVEVNVTKTSDNVKTSLPNAEVKVSKISCDMEVSKSSVYVNDPNASDNVKVSKPNTEVKVSKICELDLPKPNKKKFTKQHDKIKCTTANKKARIGKSGKEVIRGCITMEVHKGKASNFEYRHHNLELKDKHGPDLRVVTYSPEPKVNKHDSELMAIRPELKVNHHGPEPKANKHVPELKANKRVPELMANKHGPELKANKHSQEYNFNKHCPEQKVNKHGPEPKANKHGQELKANKCGPEIMANKQGPELKANKHSQEYNFNKHGPEPKANKHGPELKVNKHGPGQKVNKHGPELEENKYGPELKANINVQELKPNKHGQELMVNRHGPELKANKHGQELIANKHGPEKDNKHSREHNFNKHGPEPKVNKHGPEKEAYKLCLELAANKHGPELEKNKYDPESKTDKNVPELMTDKLRPEYNVGKHDPDLKSAMKNICLSISNLMYTLLVLCLLFTSVDGINSNSDNSSSSGTGSTYNAFLPRPDLSEIGLDIGVPNYGTDNDMYFLNTNSNFHRDYRNRPLQSVGMNVYPQLYSHHIEIQQEIEAGIENNLIDESVCGVPVPCTNHDHLITQTHMLMIIAQLGNCYPVNMHCENIEQYHGNRIPCLAHLPRMNWHDRVNTWLGSNNVSAIPEDVNGNGSMGGSELEDMDNELDNLDSVSQQNYPPAEVPDDNRNQPRTLLQDVNGVQPELFLHYYNGDQSEIPHQYDDGDQSDILLQNVNEDQSEILLDGNVNQSAIQLPCVQRYQLRLILPDVDLQCIPDVDGDKPITQLQDGGQLRLLLPDVDQDQPMPQLLPDVDGDQPKLQSITDGDQPRILLTDDDWDKPRTLVQVIDGDQLGLMLPDIDRNQPILQFMPDVDGDQLIIPLPEGNQPQSENDQLLSLLFDGDQLIMLPDIGRNHPILQFIPDVNGDLPRIILPEGNQPQPENEPIMQFLNLAFTSERGQQDEDDQLNLPIPNLQDDLLNLALLEVSNEQHSPPPNPDRVQITVNFEEEAETMFMVNPLDTLENVWNDICIMVNRLLNFEEAEYNLVEEHEGGEHREIHSSSHDLHQVIGYHRTFTVELLSVLVYTRLYST